MSQDDRNQLIASANRSLENAIMRADLHSGKTTMAHVAEQLGYEALIFEILEPILTTLGERLKRQEASLAQSYVSSMMVEEALRLFQTSSASQKTEYLPRKGPVVLANIEDDCHPLGRKIVSTFLAVNQWEVVDLGIDVDAKTIVDTAERVGAKVIGVSAMIYTTAENIRKVREELNSRLLRNRIKLAVGGAVFRLRPELAAKVGGDGTAPNAFAASALFDTLLKQVEKR